MNRSLLELITAVFLVLVLSSTANAFDKDSLVWKKCTGMIGSWVVMGAFAVGLTVAFFRNIQS